MSQTPGDPPRRRFPLDLDRTRPVTRRLVGDATTAPAGPPPARTAGAAVATGGEGTLLRPQRTLAHAAREAAAPVAVSGLGLESERFRRRMVERIRAEGGMDEAVLAALAAVPRHAFVDPALVAQAYEDTSLPIGLGQTISKPSVVARMLSLLRARPGGPALGRVLEIGTGCGYQAALLCQLARQVYSVERLKGLHDKARENLAALRPAHLRLIYGDGRLGHAPNAPYDGIVAAAGGDSLPEAWFEQLAPGGRLVAPCLDAARGLQLLVVVDKLADGRRLEHRHEAVRFVPLESGTSDHRPA